MAVSPTTLRWLSVALPLVFIALTPTITSGCGSPAVPANAKVDLSSDSIQSGTVATYTCDQGYELFGSATSVCQPEGRWQGDLPFCGTNIALHRPANQSTTVRGGSAGNANDGDRTSVHDGRRCTESQREASPWWQVDLLRPYPVIVVRITTRGCCGQQPLQELEIRVGNSTELQRNPLCAWYPGTLEEGVTKTFTCARTLIGQHVFLQLVGVEGSLSLCEVEIFTPAEFSNDRCVKSDASGEFVAFDRTCYEFNTGKGGSFADARGACHKGGGDLAHALRGVHNTFLLAELERRKPTLKTQLVWIGARKDPGITSRTWKWVNGEVIVRPSWGKDQPNNYNGEQNCIVLDGGSNWLWNDVGCNLDYLHWICQYKPSTCGSPDKKLNTTIIGSNYTVGSEITYKCPEGHMLVGSKVRKCGPDGFWTGMAPSCNYVECKEIADIENGDVTLKDNKTWFGSVATFSCHQNYTLEGETNRTCGEDGMWTGKESRCLFDWCSDPPQAEGADVTASGRKVGSTATYTCKPGFILFGSQVLTCGLGGEWTGKAPTCRFIDCREPARVENGHYKLLNGTTTHGSIVEYQCDSDFWLEPVDRSHLTCTRHATWQPSPPACDLISCGEPDVPQGGYVVGYDFNIHSVIEFHCEPGHMLRGRHTLECGPSGEWDGTPPSCIYIDCGKVPTIPYGSISYINSTTYLGSEVIYSCSKHYRLSGVTQRTCQESRQWSDSLPRCEEMRCGEPIVPAHAILSVTGNDRLYGRTLIKTQESGASVQTYRIGSLVKYRCERGYRLDGDPLSTCEDSARWSGSVPHCIFVDCGMPSSPVHGKVTLASNATYYGAAALYECQDNFIIDGFPRRLCLENGTWSSDTPLCKEVKCGEAEVKGGLEVQVSTYSVGGVAHYECPKGHNLHGNTTRVCSKKGSWAGPLPACKPVDCGDPGTIDNGRVIIMNDTTTYNSAVEYHCVPGFSRVGPYLRKCMEDATWSGEQPLCQLSQGSSTESQTLGVAIGVGAGILLFLLLILGIIYIRLRRETPVKNTENIQGALRKEDENAAVMSYANLNGDSNNIYENIHDHESMYDAPFDESSHYEPSPVTQRHNDHATVTINGVAVR